MLQPFWYSSSLIVINLLEMQILSFSLSVCHKKPRKADSVERHSGAPDRNLAPEEPLELYFTGKKANSNVHEDN